MAEPILYFPFSKKILSYFLKYLCFFLITNCRLYRWFISPCWSKNEKRFY